MCMVNIITGMHHDFFIAGVGRKTQRLKAFPYRKSIKGDIPTGHITI